MFHLQAVALINKESQFIIHLVSQYPLIYRYLVTFHLCLWRHISSMCTDTFQSLARELAHNKLYKNVIYIKLEKICHKYRTIITQQTLNLQQLNDHFHFKEKYIHDSRNFINETVCHVCLGLLSTFSNILICAKLCKLAFVLGWINII